MKEIVVTIHDRRVANKEELKEFFKDMKDGKHLLIRKDYRRRSLPQNAYYWGVVVAMVKRGLQDVGYDDVQTSEDAHEILKHVFLKQHFVNKETGEVIELSGSTRLLTIPEFNEFIERVIKWASEYLGVVIPSPSDEYALMGEYTARMEKIVDEQGDTD